MEIVVVLLRKMRRKVAGVCVVLMVKVAKIAALFFLSKDDTLLIDVTL